MTSVTSADYVSSVVDEHSVGPVKTDEDDFKMLQARSLDDMFDESFKNFAKWMRKTYTKKYPITKMREMNKWVFYRLVIVSILSVSMYSYLRANYFEYAWLWSLPFFIWNVFCVTKHQEIAHVRTHWTTNMTGNLKLDRIIDTTMISLTGMSKESYRRRHVSAHYADVANIARVFSDVWLPFITFPAVYYLRPWKIYQLTMDKVFCAKEKLNRTQLVIEMIGLYLYMLTLFVEVIFFKSFFLSVFHLVPLLVYQGAVVASASFAHSGIDKRNSFNSNGCFDPDTLPAKKGLFATSIRVIGVFGNWAVLNHGIHHAFTQLPLQVVNEEFKFINKHVIEGNYKHVRYNNLHSLTVFGHLFDRIPEPRWYDYVIQTAITTTGIFAYALTVAGVPVLPNTFEPLMVDYRIIFYSSKAERSAGILAFWNTVRLTEFYKVNTTPNAYLQRVIKNFDYHESVVKQALARGEKIQYPPKEANIYADELLRALWKLSSGFQFLPTS